MCLKKTLRRGEVEDAPEGEGLLEKPKKDQTKERDKLEGNSAGRKDTRYSSVRVKIEHARR